PARADKLRWQMRMWLTGGHGGLDGASGSPGPQSANSFHCRADHERAAECDQQAGPRLVLERRSANAAERICVTHPDDRCYGRADHEGPSPEADDAAGHGHCRAASRNEPAQDDEPDPEPVEHVLGPSPAPGTPLAGEEPASGKRTEAPPDQIGEVVSGESAA